MNIKYRLCVLLLTLIPGVSFGQMLATVKPTGPFDPAGYIWIPPTPPEPAVIAPSKEQNFNSEPLIIDVPNDLFKDDISLDELIQRLKDQHYQFTERDVQCMARNIYHEAANEPYKGMVLVGIVTLNRLVSPNYPKTVCDVIYQRGPYTYYWKNKRKTVTVCQFTWTCERVRLPQEGDPRWIKSLQIARNLADGKYPEWREKWIRSHHYHAYYVNPGWRLTRLGRVGAHIFYE